ncbi:MAG: hypothetical protein QOF22_2191 [Bradyrhizobium sp.]|nr:hypothetical protein [Bradyrhizobium sp.]
MRFFFDNNLPIRLARALRVLAPEHEIIHLTDKFAANTPDTEWMRGLADALDWVIISGDIRIGKNVHEVQAWRAAGHTIFFLKAGWITQPFWTQAWKFVKCFPGIVTVAEEASSGDSFFVSVNGKIS